MAQNSSDYLTASVLKICLRDVLYQIAEDLQYEHNCHNGYYYYFLNLVLFLFHISMLGLHCEAYKSP
jgi:hypothetical protein